MAAPRRGAGRRRHPWRGRVGVDTRLLGAASPPEADRGGAGAGAARRRRGGDGRRRGEGGQGRRLPQRRHRRVHLPGRRVLLPRDEHSAAGRAPRHGGDHRHRPRRVADQGGFRRAAADDPGRGARLPPRPRHRGAHQRRGPRRREVPALARADHRADGARRLRGPLRHRVPLRRRGQPVLRQPRRQVDRVGQGPADGDRQDDPRPRGDARRRRGDDDPRRPGDPAPRRLRRRHPLDEVGGGGARPVSGGRRRHGDAARGRRERRAAREAPDHGRGQRQALRRQPVGARVGGGCRCAGGQGAGAAPGRRQAAPARPPAAGT